MDPHRAAGLRRVRDNAPRTVNTRAGVAACSGHPPGRRTPEYVRLASRFCDCATKFVRQSYTCNCAAVPGQLEPSAIASARSFERRFSFRSRPIRNARLSVLAGNGYKVDERLTCTTQRPLWRIWHESTCRSVVDPERPV